MKRAILAFALLCLGAPAWAQGVSGVPTNGAGQVPTLDPNNAAFQGLRTFQAF